ncbi:IS200/IS605 family transposase, partial [Enterococcus hirae]|nr:IS200/IS605 family transposase [Enterococcus hirae]
PKTELTKFINAYKSASSRLIKRDFPKVKQFLWKEMFWSKSFCLLTTGGAPIDVIKKYIQNQGNNHKSATKVRWQVLHLNRCFFNSR